MRSALSTDTLIELRTPFSAGQVRAVLVDDPALADLHLVNDPADRQVCGYAICAIVLPWKDNDHDLIENGFLEATVTCTLISGRGEAGWSAALRLIAAILRLVPGDLCLASQDAGGPDLLRLGDIIYVNPDGFGPGELAELGFTPLRLVAGIPDRRR